MRIVTSSMMYNVVFVFVTECDKMSVVQESCASVPRRGWTATSWRTGARRAGRSAPAMAPAAADCVNVSSYFVV